MVHLNFESLNSDSTFIHLFRLNIYFNNLMSFRLPKSPPEQQSESPKTKVKSPQSILSQSN